MLWPGSATARRCLVSSGVGLALSGCLLASNCRDCFGVSIGSNSRNRRRILNPKVLSQKPRGSEFYKSFPSTCLFSLFSLSLLSLSSLSLSLSLSLSSLSLSLSPSLSLLSLSLSLSVSLSLTDSESFVSRFAKDLSFIDVPGRSWILDGVFQVLCRVFAGSAFIQVLARVVQHVRRAPMPNFGSTGTLRPLPKLSSFQGSSVEGLRIWGLRIADCRAQWWRAFRAQSVEFQAVWTETVWFLVGNGGMGYWGIV